MAHVLAYHTRPPYSSERLPPGHSTRDLRRLGGQRADVDGLLSEATRQHLRVRGLPLAVERVGQHLHHHHIVLFDLAFGRDPLTLRRRAHVAVTPSLGLGLPD